MEKIYKAHWGLSVKIVTGVVCVSILVMFLVSAGLQSFFPWSVRLFILLLPFTILLSMWIRRVRYYKVSESNIIIERFWGRRSLALANILEVQKPYVRFTKLRKIWGNAGIFSYTGTYQYPKLGRFSCYVTDWDNAVYLKLAKGGVMISPREEEAFLDHISDAIPTL